LSKEFQVIDVTGALLKLEQNCG